LPFITRDLRIQPRKVTFPNVRIHCPVFTDQAIKMVM